MSTVLKSRSVVVFGLIILAVLFRFYRLGEWPFAIDETSTIIEEKSLFLDEHVPQDSQTYRLPRIIPLSYLFHHISNTLFGRDEFGSRVIMAVFGTVIVGIVFLLLDMLEARPAAIATALLVALWPEHVFRSQQTRYYIMAAFFSFLCLLVGAFVAQRRSTLLSIIVCCLVFATILCHTLMGILLGIILAGIIAASYAERQPLPKNVILVFLATGILIAGFFIIYLKPLITGWNSGASWGYGVIHSVLASINMIGWPVALLAALGLLLSLPERNAQNWYWVTCSFGWAAASVVLPLFVAYHPGYVFPLALSVLVLAGLFMGTVYDLLKEKSVLLGVAWIGLACLWNLPSLASHYVDGSRIDMRTAAQYVKKNWQSGDRVTGFSMGIFAYYAEDCTPAIPLSSTKPIPKLKELTSHQGRLWIVLESYRAGLSKDLQQWLGVHCSHELKVRRNRFDYAEYFVDVYLFSPVKITSLKRTQQIPSLGNLLTFQCP